VYRKVLGVLSFLFLPFLFLLLLSTLNASEQTRFTIAIDPEYIPFTQKDIDGKPVGLLVDFWNLWAKENGYSVSYRFYPWEETIEATRRAEVDFHSGTTKDREWMHASIPIYEMATGLFVLNTFPVTTMRDLVGKRIGTIDPYYGELVQKALGNKVTVKEYDDYTPLVEALKNGEIDAFIDDVEAIRYFLIKTGQLQLFKRVDIEALQFTNKIYAITNPDKAALLPQINRGLKRLKLEDLAKIEAIWLSHAEDAYYTKKLSKSIHYTPKEKEWIGHQKYFTVTGDPGWRLSEDMKTYRGVAGEYLSRISQNMKAQFSIKPIESWAELLATPSDESVDIVMGTMTDEVKKLLEERYIFLQPYAISPLVIVTDQKMRFVTGLSDLKERHIGILNLQHYTKEVIQHYEKYHFTRYGTIHHLLKHLSEGKLDAAVLPLPEAILALAQREYSTLDIIGKMDTVAYVNVGILKTKPLLVSVMDKAIKSISMYDKKEILSRWTQKLNYVEKIDYSLLYIISSGLLFLLITALYVTHTYKKKHEYEKELSCQMEVLSLKDDLTGLGNKRAFNQNFESAHQDKKTLGLLFIDVDYFKKYNDFYGHLAGDTVLKKIATVLKRFASDSVFCYRIGGEEFGCVVYDFSQAEAVALAQEICDAIEKENLSHQKAPGGVITVSVGVALDSSTQSRKKLYMASDKALYEAKKSGRNQVCLESV